MTRYALKILRSQPLRLVLTVAGIALCVLLMLFLLAIYYGVEYGTMEFIRQNRADLWVVQKNAENILRHVSVLLMNDANAIRQMPEVESVSPLVMLISGIKKDHRILTIFLAGYDPSHSLGGPPRIAAGRAIVSDDEIVLDRAFAKKHGFHVGDSVQILDHRLKVVGLSDGTNSFVVQYAFVTLRRAQAIFGFPSMVTAYLVKVRPGVSAATVAENIQKNFPQLKGFDHETFVKNNVREMEAGLMPVYYTVAVIGTIVLTAILSLILSMSVIERRRDFAVMKTLGAPDKFFPLLVLRMSFLMTSSASLLAIALFFPMTKLLEEFSPEITTRISFGQITSVIVAVSLVSLVSALLTLRRLRSIYAIESFATLGGS